MADKVTVTGLTETFFAFFLGGFTKGLFETFLAGFLASFFTSFFLAFSNGFLDGFLEVFFRGFFKVFFYGFFEPFFKGFFIRSPLLQIFIFFRIALFHITPEIFRQELFENQGSWA